MKKIFALLLVLFVLPSFACVTLTGGNSKVPVADMGNNGEQNGNLPWYDEDGQAIVGNPNTPRFSVEVGNFISSYYGVPVIDHGTWMQATLPDGTVISWAEWGEDSLTLGQIDGLYEGKSVFVAMRDYDDWVNNPLVQHTMCVGTFIPSYNAGMASFDVHQSTILQFDGSGAASFMNNFSPYWAKIRADLKDCPRQ